MQDELRARLRALHDQYTEAVNAAVAEGRDDIIADLAADYPDTALRILGDSGYQLHAV